MIEVRELRAFVAIVDLGSFTAAADALGVPRSTLSTSIKALESRLKVRLLHRTTRVVAPTEEGLVLASTARKMLADLDHLEQGFADQSSIAGVVRISLPGRIAHQIVIPALPRFLAEHEGLSVDLKVDDRLVDLVVERVDIAVRVGALVDSTLICRPLTKLRFVSAASPDYLARHGVPTSIADLAGHRAVAYNSDLRTRSTEIELAGQAVTLDATVAVNSTDSYFAAGLAGLGIIQVPAYDAAEALSDGSLVEVLPKVPPMPDDLTLLYPSRDHLPRRIVCVRDWLRQLLEGVGQRE